MAHWDSLFLALATALNDHQEIPSILSTTHPNSTAAIHNALQSMLTTIMTMKAATMSPYSKKPLPVTPDQMIDWCNDGEFAFCLTLTTTKSTQMTTMMTRQQ